MHEFAQLLFPTFHLIPKIECMSRLITHHSAACLLAVRVGQLRLMVRNGEVPHIVLPNGEIRFRVTSLDHWIDQHERIPKPQEQL